MIAGGVDAESGLSRDIIPFSNVICRIGNNIVLFINFATVQPTSNQYNRAGCPRIRHAGLLGFLCAEHFFLKGLLTDLKRAVHGTVSSSEMR
mgnify:CR=1 FL=1